MKSRKYIIEIENLNKDYMQGGDPVPVLHDINFRMKKGEYVAIMGPSGSGKTTLMNIIGCLDQATSGSYIFDGVNVGECDDDTLADLRLQKIGFIFQNFELLPRQTALQNVEIPLTYNNVKPNERKERAIHALERMGLESRVDFKVTKLSGGQKQRVAIARALVNHPQILLADEPTGALDSKSGQQIMELFRELNDEGVAILMITHDPNVAAYADRLVTIKDGRLTEEGGKTGEEKE